MSEDATGHPDQPVSLSITSDTVHIAGVRAAVIEMCERIGFDADLASAVALAVNEAVANVIKHGYEGVPGQPIDVTLSRVSRGEQTAIEIVICDCARHVDPDKITGRDLDDLRPGGLGTHIMKTLMDEVKYTPRQPAGMELRLLKMLPRDRASAPDRPGDSQEDSADG